MLANLKSVGRSFLVLNADVNNGSEAFCRWVVQL